MNETREAMVKRLHMRSMRRGIKEMDLILSNYASLHLAAKSDDDLVLYDALLSENDHDIYSWINGQTATPATYAELIAQIAKGATGLTRPA